MLKLAIVIFAVIMSGECFADGWNWNHEAAVNYAKTWASKYNPCYDKYEDYDCANFVSQCLIAGGLDLSTGVHDCYGCITSCTKLNDYLVKSPAVSQHINLPSSDPVPTWFSPGDVAILSDDNGNKHAVIALLDGRILKCAGHQEPAPGGKYLITQFKSPSDKPWPNRAYYHLVDQTDLSASATMAAVASGPTASTPNDTVPGQTAATDTFQFLVSDDSRSHFEEWKMYILPLPIGGGSLPALPDPIATFIMCQAGATETKEITLSRDKLYWVVLDCGTAKSCPTWSARVTWKEAGGKSGQMQIADNATTPTITKPLVITTDTGGLWQMFNTDGDFKRDYSPSEKKVVVTAKIKAQIASPPNLYASLKAKDNQPGSIANSAVPAPKPDQAVTKPSTPAPVPGTVSVVDAQLAKEVLDYAKLSCAVYNVGKKSCVMPGNWKEVPTKQPDDLTSGFVAQAYRNGTQVVIVFRGTDDWADWMNNAVNFLGYPAEQYYQGIELVRGMIESAEKQGCTEVVLTGHSLGGGIASFAALWFAKKAIIFNAAGLGDGMRADINIKPNLEKHQSLIHNIDMEGDPVSELGKQVGVIYTLTTPKKMADENFLRAMSTGAPTAVDLKLEPHSMETVITALQALIK